MYELLGHVFPRKNIKETLKDVSELKTRNYQLTPSQKFSKDPQIRKVIGWLRAANLDTKADFLEEKLITTKIR